VIHIRISPACFTPVAGILRGVAGAVDTVEVTAVVVVVVVVVVVIVDVVGGIEVVDSIEVVDGVFEHAAATINPIPANIIIVFLNIFALFIGCFTRM
jgi:hypothetical protein